MATLKEIETALINADAAGDTEAAQRLADAVREMRAAEEAQSRSQMTHPYNPGKPFDKYAQQAGKQSFGQNFMAGIGGTLQGMWESSLPGRVSNNPQAAFDAYAQNLPIPEGYDVKEHKAAMGGLRTTAGGNLGEFAGYAGPAAVGSVLGGSSVLGAGLTSAAMGGLIPAETIGERTFNTAIGFGAGAGGQKLSNTLANWAVKNRTMKTVQPDKMLDATKQETLRKGLEMGYKVPPSAAGKQSLLETVGGQIKTQQVMSDQNQPITNAAIRKMFRLTNDQPITSKTMKSIREKAGQIYADLKMQGRVYLDDAYKGTQQSEYENLFPGTLPKKDYFESKNLVERMKQLRHDGHERLKAWRASDGDPELLAQAKTMLAEAGELEGLIERHLQRNGNARLLDRFREARRTIAQTYDVQDTILEGAGDVDALKIGALYQMGEKGNGPPLTGELADIGRFASTFPQSTKLRTFETPVNSALDYATAALAASNATAPAGWLAAGLPMARGPARAWMSRPAYQAKLPSVYKDPNVLERALPYLTDYTPQLLGQPLPVGRAITPGMLTGWLLEARE